MDRPPDQTSADALAERERHRRQALPPPARRTSMRRPETAPPQVPAAWARRRYSPSPWVERDADLKPVVAHGAHLGSRGAVIEQLPTSIPASRKMVLDLRRTAGKVGAVIVAKLG
jgi:hypothetical protein